ncbi:D-alanyl-D-alanine carboxypeptidase [Microcoleus sp. FACHB-1515]|uniref:D-alanyl-D-alanine carboxypeptidase n=1 Tax=Cyanophyceae TaxID=3028117 RepID=UPI001686CAC0|nr:D-alanyl-D-alanine carboxypeptidase [Microcoleus sp. FACHB-1515]MBD2090174.1 D-alanyl-D-alanine carboxypeptidase [Microcoleus sp. FACHB-1515]
MLEGFHLLLLTWLGGKNVETLRSTNLSQWFKEAAIEVVAQAAPAPDPAAVAATRLHLGTMAQIGMPVNRQGVWLQVNNQVVAENQGTTALSAASLTKIATTLAAIATWGVDHQFETIVSATAPPQNGVVTGDLIVQGAGDPFFVWEEAIALANALQEMGVDRVTGNLVIAGNFAMNFQTDPAAAGRLLRQGMNSNSWNAEASSQFATLPQGTARPTLQIGGEVRVVSLSEAQTRSIVPLVRHQSLPLSQILKAMNSFSNNAMSEMLAAQLGGGPKVAQTAAQIAKVPPEEIQLINGSGLGNENRISPRAVTAMLLAIQTYLQPQQLNVADVFPVMGRDRGTLGRRQLPAGAAVKTGTLNDVSSLAGVIPSARGPVWFAIINVGFGDLQELHRQQDLLLLRVQQQWGAGSISPEIQPGNRDRLPANRLGAPSRNQKLDLRG